MLHNVIEVPFSSSLKSKMYSTLSYRQPKNPLDIETKHKLGLELEKDTVLFLLNCIIASISSSKHKQTAGICCCFFINQTTNPAGTDCRIFIPRTRICHALLCHLFPAVAKTTAAHLIFTHIIHSKFSSHNPAHNKRLSRR